MKNKREKLEPLVEKKGGEKSFLRFVKAATRS